MDIFKKSFFSILLSSLIGLMASSTFAQIRVGDFNFAETKFKKLNQETLTEFKKQTTHFILPNKFTVEEYSTILDEVWDVTAYKITLLEDYDSKTVKPGDAMAEFIGYQVDKIEKNLNTGSETLEMRYKWHVLDFYMVDKMRKPGKKLRGWDSSKIGTIYFSEGVIAENNKPSFKTAVINFELGYLKNYLGAMNSAIKTETSHNTLEDYQKEELRNLENNVLYVDEYFAYDRRISTMGDKELSFRTDLIDIYNYKMEFIPHEELQNKILSSNSEDFYYLLVNYINPSKVITVLNGKTSEIIYQTYKKTGITISKKDIKQLNKQIQKEIDSI